MSTTITFIAAKPLFTNNNQFSGFITVVYNITLSSSSSLLCVTPTLCLYPVFGQISSVELLERVPLRPKHDFRNVGILCKCFVVVVVYMFVTHALITT